MTKKVTLVSLAITFLGFSCNVPLAPDTAKQPEEKALVEDSTPSSTPSSETKAKPEAPDLKTSPDPLKEVVEDQSAALTRDEKRLTDLKQLQTALELYSVDHDDSYPLLLSPLVPQYINKIPTDPTGNKYYFHGLNGCTDDFFNSCKNYHIGTDLEVSTNEALSRDDDWNTDSAGFILNGSDKESCMLEPGSNRYCYDYVANKNKNFFLADLTIAELRVITPQPVAGQKIQIVFGLMNNAIPGGDNVDPQQPLLYMVAESSGITITGSQPCASADLPAQSSCAIYLEGVYDSPGTKTLTVTADPANKIKESKEFNNQAAIQIDVLEN